MTQPGPDAGAARSNGGDARCRNCGATVVDAFCAHCGQETALRLPTLREFVREAAGRYVAFDGRFWRTMRSLLIRPGFLTREYLAGRRRRYIRPARLYLFSTLIFFAVSRFFVEPAEVLVAMDSSAEGRSAANADAKMPRDRRPANRNPGTATENPGFLLDDDLAAHMPPTLARAVTPLEKRWERFNALPRDEKEDHIVAGMLRYGPYAMFVLLPAFALLLKVVYLGRRRRYPSRPRLYGEHMVFAAHSHAFLFAMATAALLIRVPLLRTAIVVWMCVYLLWSMRAVYGGSWFGAATRAFALFVAYSTLLGIASVGLLVAAILV